VAFFFFFLHAQLVENVATHLIVNLG
jgi:hypothetical protein